MRRAMPLGTCVQEQPAAAAACTASMPPGSVGLAEWSVRESFDGAVVLITGATGFLGSLVLEQLLRCCPGVRRIYILTRSKKGASAEQRVQRLLDSQLFHLVRKAGPYLADKVVVVSGDLEAGFTPQGGQGGPPATGTAAGAPPAACCMRHNTKLSQGSTSAGTCADDLPPVHTGQGAHEAASGWRVASPPSYGSERLPSAVSGAEVQPQACNPAAKPLWPDAQLPLGITDAKLLAQMLEETTHIIHSAASITLEEHIHVSLKSNYVGTQQVLEVALRMPRLRVMTHVSTAYANIDLPLGATAEERVYLLYFGDREVDHADQVRKILAACPSVAAAKALGLRSFWGFPNNYTLGKRLTELMVRDYSQRLAAETVIVRPSFIGALAGAPCPGHTGNMAGPSGIGTAFGLGFYQEHTLAWRKSGLNDCVPGDVAASVVTAAAAAAGAGVWPTAGATPQAPTPGGTGGGAAAAAQGGTGQHDPALGAQPQHLPAHAAAAAGGSAAGGGAGGVGSVAHAAQGPRPKVVHATSSTINPMLNRELYELAYNFFTRNPPRFKIFLGDYLPADRCWSEARTPDGSLLPTPDLHAVERGKAKVRRRIKLVTALLRLFGFESQAHKLTVGFQQWDEANSQRHDLGLLFSSGTSLALESTLVAEERRDFPLVWRGDWLPYGEMYLAELSRRFMGGPKKRAAAGKGTK